MTLEDRILAANSKARLHCCARCLNCSRDVLEEDGLLNRAEFALSEVLDVGFLVPPA